MANDDDQFDEDMDAEGAEDGEEGEEGEGKKGGKKKLLMILVPVLLLVGGGAGAYFMGMLDSVLGVKAAEECVTDDHGEEVCTPVEDEEHAEGEEGAAEGGDHGEKGGEGGLNSAFLAVPPMLVNLKSEDGIPRNFRLKIFLELKNSKDKDKVEAILPRVISEFQIYLRELYVKDLKGSAGIYRLKIELLWRVNQAVKPIEIKDVLFQEILIQ